MNLRTAIISTFASGSLTLCGALMAQAAPTTAAPAGQNAATQLDGNDEDFLEAAAHAGHTEIEGSKLAQTKATNPDVKAFAEKMIMDHTKVGQELQTLAKSKGYTPPAEPSLVQKTKLKALSVMDDSFDKRYVNQIGVAAHEDAVELFQEASADAKDPEIKAFAAEKLPALQEHLEMAKALKQKVDPAK
ncbi:DUF305 domain-containing protein [Pollutimonas subterranea]|uniref:DUF305 domain-containing protein n=1 Tax=Pollutimonas subterranea TaxID=2045210 RepID=A0A2N4U435_9BURK|nr:DUF4142 domain-containing protein [Pollutimonas subterranea]PLC49771.1 DUF305 domain-containing protein [Pollutimonas subterranea]